MRVEGSDGDWSAAVSGGFLSVAKDRVSVLAERAVLADDIDSAAARSAMEQARREIESATEDGERERAMADLQYAAAQLRAVGESVD